MAGIYIPDPPGLPLGSLKVWISYFPVATTTANYFEKSSSAINWFSFVFMIVPSIAFFFTTYLSQRHGLKLLVHIGAAFNLTGTAVKALATSGIFNDKDTQYTIALIGQIIAAVAQTFVIYIPTKVSHSWFPTKERGIATGILSLSYSLGITLTNLITPAIVQEDESKIPTLAYICFGIAAFTEVLAIIMVTSSHPKTSPSNTSGKENASPLSYWNQLKEALTSPPFIIILLLFSTGVGFVAGFNTLTQQIICTVGYSDQLAGSCIAAMYFAGYIGAVVVTPIAHSTGKFEEIIKMGMALASVAFIGLCEVVLIPNVVAAVVLMFAVYGFCSTGIFPVGLEMTVESTYPIDESIPIGLIYFFGQLFAILMIYIVPALAREVPLNDNNVCNLNSAKVKQLDYSISMSVTMTILSIIYMAGILLFKPVYKRRDFEQSLRQKHHLKHSPEHEE